MRNRERYRAGVGMMEVLVATLIVGIVMVAALRSLGAAVRASVSIAQHHKAVGLAEELMSEILQASYHDPEGEDTIGLDSGESATPRTSFDDIDDFDGWTASPPVTAAGVPKEDHVNWSRSVQVAYVAPTTPDGAALSTSARSGAKRVIVTVAYKGTVLYRLQSLQTERWMDAYSGIDATNPLPCPAMNQPPVAEIRADKVAGAAPLGVNLDGAFSFDPEGGTLDYHWIVDGVQIAGNATQSLTFSTSGVHHVVLRVVDDRGAQDMTQLWFHVE